MARWLIQMVSETTTIRRIDDSMMVRPKDRADVGKVKAAGAIVHQTKKRQVLLAQQDSKLAQQDSRLCSLGQWP